MIKKLAVAVAFAGSMVVGVPTASANSQAICYAQYEANMASCAYNDDEGVATTCSQFASITLHQCLARLATVNE